MIKTLYKYRGNSDYTDKIIVDKSVWLSNAKGLNDPFECSIQEIAKDWIKARVKTMKEAQLSGLVFTYLKFKKTNSSLYGMSSEETKNFMNNLKALPNLDEKYELFRELLKSRIGNYPPNPADTFIGFDKQLNEVGIFSLSETSENLLMWSHYAEDAKGIAIGFEVNSKLANGVHCLKVNYSDTLPAYSSDGFIAQMSYYYDEFLMPYAKQKISFTDPTFKLAISTKPTVWEYEREWRYVEEESGTYPLPSKISEIVFGLRCSIENRNRYKEMVKLNFGDSISFFEIQQVPNSNRIVKVKIED